LEDYAFDVANYHQNMISQKPIVSRSKTLNMTKEYEYKKYVAKILRSEYDRVWLWKDIPESTLVENKIIMDHDVYSENKQDIGMDLIAVKNGIYTYIRCKDCENDVQIGDIAEFLFFMINNNVDGTLCYSNGIRQNLVDRI